VISNTKLEPTNVWIGTDSGHQDRICQSKPTYPDNTHRPCSSLTLHQIPLVPYDPGIEATGPGERGASALPCIKKQESAEHAWEHWESVSTSECHEKLLAAGRGQ